MGEQLSLKAAMPLAEIIATCRKNVGNTGPRHIWWDDKDYTQYIIHALCAIETSCLHSLNDHYPYHLSYPWPCWDDGNYSYPSLIRRGLLSQRQFCGHSSVPEINLRGVSIGRPKICKLQKHKLTAVSNLCRSLGCFVIWHSFSGRYLAWWIWLEDCHFDNYVLSLTAVLVALWYILENGCITKLHSIPSVTWREQGLWLVPQISKVNGKLDPYYFNKYWVKS